MVHPVENDDEVSVNEVSVQKNYLLTQLLDLRGKFSMS